MKIYLECLPCVLRQALDASKMATDDNNIQKKIMMDVIDIISRYEEYRYSPELCKEIHDVVKEYTGESDPYKDIKKESIRIAKELYPYVKGFLNNKKESERLYWALKISATGNVIDYAIDIDIDIEKQVKTELEKKFAISDIKKLEEKMLNAENILILGDNAGETVFDKVLIEELDNYEINYAVRNEPIINDATYEDAYNSGLNECSKIISSGCNTPGLVLEESSKGFMEIFKNSDIIISKGQGNYETLSETNEEIFFLLKAKCPVLSDMIGVNVNDYVFKYKG